MQAQRPQAKPRYPSSMPILISVILAVPKVCPGQAETTSCFTAASCPKSFDVARLARQFANLRIVINHAANLRIDSRCRTPC